MRPIQLLCLFGLALLLAGSLAGVVKAASDGEPPILTPTMLVDAPISTPTAKVDQPLPELSPTIAVTPTVSLPLVSTPTATFPPASTATATIAPPLYLTAVEPLHLSAAAGGLITLFGEGFGEGCLVRMNGAGLLDTNYVSQVLLQALVPAGLAPGVYGLQAFCPDGRTADLPASLTLDAPLPSPTQSMEPTPDSRAPALVVCSHSTKPTRVMPGEDFTLNVGVCNAGAAEAESVIATFGGGAFVVLDQDTHTLGNLLPGESASTQQRIRAPQSAIPGMHLVEIGLQARDSHGTSLSFSQSIAVEVGIAPTPTAISGGVGVSSIQPPRLVAQSSSSEPGTLSPRTRFRLVVILANIGGSEAQSIFARAIPNQMIGATLGTGFESKANLSNGGQAALSFEMIVSAQASPGYQPIDIEIEYADRRGNPYSSTEQVWVEIGAGGAQRPRLVISEYETEPTMLAPGSEFMLSLRIQNVGGSPASQVSLSLGGERGDDLRPFAPIGMGNVIYLEYLGAGETAEVSIRLTIDGSSQASVHPLRVSLTYNDERSAPYAEDQVISLAVHRTPQLRIGFYETVRQTRVGQSTRLPLEIVNQGSEDVNVLLVEVTGEGWDFESGAPISGRMEAGSFLSVDANATPMRSGALTINVLVTYLDAFNQPQTIEYTLYVTVEDAPFAPSHPEPSVPRQEMKQSSFWQVVCRFFMGILGLGS